MIMSKEEIKISTQTWPANVKQPIDRDTQILLMQTSQQRRKDSINRIMKLIEDERKGQ